MTLKENRRKKVPIENPEVLFAQVLFYPSSENSMGLHMFPFCPAIDPALEKKKAWLPGQCEYDSEMEKEGRVLTQQYFIKWRRKN